jgi:hypothetical protein
MFNTKRINVTTLNLSKMIFERHGMTKHWNLGTSLPKQKLLVRQMGNFSKSVGPVVERNVAAE